MNTNKQAMEWMEQLVAKDRKKKVEKAMERAREKAYEAAMEQEEKMLMKLGDLQSVYNPEDWTKMVLSYAQPRQGKGSLSGLLRYATNYILQNEAYSDNILLARDSERQKVRERFVKHHKSNREALSKWKKRYE